MYLNHQMPQYTDYLKEDKDVPTRSLYEINPPTAEGA